MTIQEVVTESVKGGFFLPFNDSENSYESDDLRLIWILMQPDFWKCLGESMLWNGFYRGVDDDTWSLYDLSYKDGMEDVRWIPKWEKKWHQLVEHLALGGTIDTYFEPFKKIC